MSNTENSILYTKDRVSKLRQASSELGGLAAKSPTFRLDPTEIQSVAEINSWLQEAQEKIDVLANQWEREAESVLRSPDVLSRVNFKYNSSTLALQDSLQKQGRLIQTATKVIRAMRDTALATLSNLR